MLRGLLAEPGVVEVCELRSRFGFMAVHGGSLEQVTDFVAIEAANRSGASVYAIQQPRGFRWHIPAIAMDPDDSPAMRSFLDHVDVVVSIHGFGIDSLWVRTRANATAAKGADRSSAADRTKALPDLELSMALLLGGGNRDLAARLRSVLGPALDGYAVVDDLDFIPVRLRGLHRANPVNLPRDGGVQLELCPSVRGLGMKWRHLADGERPPETGALIDALATVASDEAIV